LFYIYDGRRVLLAKCRPVIEIHETSTPVNVLGSQGASMKTYHIALVLCDDREETREVDAEFINIISHFEFTCDIQRIDGNFERINFDAISPGEIILDGDWKFESARQDIIKKLLAF